MSRISQKTWESAPIITEKYFSKNSIFEKVEDISEEETTTGATDKVWLKFTTKWTWPGPTVKLVGGPLGVEPRLGLRGIPYDSIKVTIEHALEVALHYLRGSNGGDKFVGAITLSWPLTAPGVAPEPYYTFTTNLYHVIQVGAYSGEVTRH